MPLTSLSYVFLLCLATRYSTALIWSRSGLSPFCVKKREYLLIFVIAGQVNHIRATRFNRLHLMVGSCKVTKLIPCFKSLSILTYRLPLGFPLIETYNVSKNMRGKMLNKCCRFLLREDVSPHPLI